MRSQCELVFARRVLPALLSCLISGFLISGTVFAFQAGPPANGGPQGAFTSSGAPPNTAGEQGAFTSSGAPPNTAGPQAAVPPTGVVQGTDPSADDQDVKLAGIDSAVRSGNLEALRQYLQDTDAAVQAEAFEALAARDANLAIQSLLAIIRDPNQLTRVQALQLLDTSPQVDEQTALAALRVALVDPDPLLREYAAEALAARDAPDVKPGTGSPVDGGPQGPFMSSGAPPNTAGPQGAFTSSGAPPNTAGPQAAVPPTAGTEDPDPIPDDQ